MTVEMLYKHITPTYTTQMPQHNIKSQNYRRNGNKITRLYNTFKCYRIQRIFRHIKNITQKYQPVIKSNTKTHSGANKIITP